MTSVTDRDGLSRCALIWPIYHHYKDTASIIHRLNFARCLSWMSLWRTYRPLSEKIWRFNRCTLSQLLSSIINSIVFHRR